MDQRHSEPVPYDRIDPLIRPLVPILNEKFGIRTLWSCSGHGRNDEAYITFVSDDNSKTAHILQSVSPLTRIEMRQNAPVVKCVWCQLTTNPGSKNLWHNLRIYGDPDWARKELIAEIEDTLSKA
jgi:hypothetical protein